MGDPLSVLHYRILGHESRVTSDEQGFVPILYPTTNTQLFLGWVLGGYFGPKYPPNQEVLGVLGVYIYPTNTRPVNAWVCFGSGILLVECAIFLIEIGPQDFPQVKMNRKNV